MNETHVLILKINLRGRHLIEHTSRGLLPERHHLSFSSFVFPSGAIDLLPLCFIPAGGCIYTPLAYFSQWVPSPCSPSATLQGALTCLWYPGFYVWCPTFVASAQQIPFDHLALEAREACVLGSHRFVTTGETVLGTLLPRALHRQQTETYPQSSCERGLFACRGASA